MGSRGRKSKTDLALAQVDVTERAGPASGLTDEQKFEWMRIVNSNPADRFDEAMLPLLESYCRHRIALRHVGQLVTDAEAGDEIDIDGYDKLLKMQERESRALASLAVRLGFAHTTAKGSNAKGKQSARKPWE